MLDTVASGASGSEIPPLICAAHSARRDMIHFRIEAIVFTGPAAQRLTFAYLAPVAIPLENRSAPGRGQVAPGCRILPATKSTHNAPLPQPEKIGLQQNRR